MQLDKKKYKKIKKNKTLTIHCSCKSFLLSCIAIGVVIVGLALIGRPSSLYAFFSDKIEGSSTISVGEIGVKITYIQAQKMVYGEGEDAIDRKGFVSAFEQPGIVLSDGYVMPFKLNIKNESSFSVDLLPQIALEWKGFASGVDFSMDGVFYIYDGADTEREIVDGIATPIGVFQDGVCTLPRIANVPAGVEIGNSTNVSWKEPEEYKLYFNRAQITGEMRQEWEDNQGLLTIKPSVKAVLPGDNGENWYTEDATKSFEVMTHIYSLPFIGNYSLGSNNVDQNTNSITVEADSPSNTAFIYSWLDSGTVYTNPRSYMVDRTLTDNSVAKGDRPHVETATDIGEIVYPDSKFMDNKDNLGIPWMYRAMYNVRSYDDYGKYIASYSNPADAADGGLVHMPDTDLREVVADKLTDGKGIEINTPLTKNRFSLADVNLQRYALTDTNKEFPLHDPITDLTGLEELNGNDLEIYIDDNDVSKLILPEGTISVLSLNHNNNIDKSSLDILRYKKTTLMKLNLNDIGLSQSEFETYIISGMYVDNSILQIIGLNNNLLNDISGLSQFKNLKEIDVGNNIEITNIVNLFGINGGNTLSQLIYFNLNGCVLDADSYNYIAPEGTSNSFVDSGKTWYRTSEFYDDTIVFYNGNDYYGSGGARSMAPALASKDTYESPSVSTEIPDSDSPENLASDSQTNPEESFTENEDSNIEANDSNQGSDSKEETVDTSESDEDGEMPNVSII